VRFSESLHAGDSVALVGHPFAPIGRGEDLRCSYRALRSVGLRPRIVDVYAHDQPEADLLSEMGQDLSRTCGRMNIFHLNGDEIEPCLAALGPRGPGPDSYNIVYPAWELPHYPGEWARELDRFDEIWAPSRFIHEALAPVVSRPLLLMPLASEVVLSGFRARRSFGIPESAYAFLFSFDLRSWASRKNPEGVVEAFRILLDRRPAAACVLVIKVNGAEHSPAGLDDLRSSIRQFGDLAILIDRTLSDNEVKNLVRCCDCFVSMHRAEGFGRGLMEAMYLGKPVIGTGWSGNMDFMDEQTAFVLGHTLTPLAEGDYPHAAGQFWAQTDPSEAADRMIELLDDPEAGRAMGRRAAVSVRRGFSFRASGMRYRSRLEAIVDSESVANANRHENGHLTRTPP
jgi:glycosyltransferase involved in cell wall biosynthesis